MGEGMVAHMHPIARIVDDDLARGGSLSPGAVVQRPASDDVRLAGTP
jgi:hypothetical protein